LHATAMRD